MEILEHLESLGFPDAAVVGLKPHQITVRVRTDKGWVYGKFDPESLPAAVDAFAAKINAPAASHRVVQVGK